MSERPTRFCPACKQADTDPRHAIFGGDPNVALHMDCCRELGCPDGTCDIVTAGGENLRGPALLAYLTDPKRQTGIRKALDARPDDVKHFTADHAPVILQGVQQ